MKNTVTLPVSIEDIKPGDYVFLNDRGNQMLDVAGYRKDGEEIRKWSCTYGIVIRRSAIDPDRWHVDMGNSKTLGGNYSTPQSPGLYYMDANEVANAYRTTEVELIEEPEVVEECPNGEYCLNSADEDIEAAIDLLTKAGLKIVYEIN